MWFLKILSIQPLSQGLASQIGTPLRQGVRRPHLILARWLPKIRRVMRTLPSSRPSISELMLVKCADVVIEILVLRLFFPRQIIVRDEPRRMVDGAGLGWVEYDSIYWVGSEAGSLVFIFFDF